MMRIGITGSSGFLGWHLRCRLLSLPQFEVLNLNNNSFNNEIELTTFVKNCDAIVHLAGMNRGPENMVENTNIALTEKLIQACQKTESVPQIIFSSSIHREYDTAYGRSKKHCEGLLRTWSDSSGARVCNLIIPNIFGEHGKPFYHSVIATFCHQLCQNETPRVEPGVTLELIHAQSVAASIINAINEKKNCDISLSGTRISIHDIYTNLRSWLDIYQSGIIPSLTSAFEISLFNTLRSFIEPNFFPFYPKLHIDERGNLFEAVKTEIGGQFFLSTTKPGITRGNHFHTRKIERFCVVSGKARISIRRLLTNEIRHYEVDEVKPWLIDIPTLHTHSITNIGSTDLLTAFWANEIFDPTDPDTFAHNI